MPWYSLIFFGFACHFLSPGKFFFLLRFSTDVRKLGRKQRETRISSYRPIHSPQLSYKASICGTDLNGKIGRSTFLHLFSIPEFRQIPSFEVYKYAKWTRRNVWDTGEKWPDHPCQSWEVISQNPRYSLRCCFHFGAASSESIHIRNMIALMLFIRLRLGAFSTLLGLFSISVFCCSLWHSNLPFQQEERGFQKDPMGQNLSSFQFPKLA